VSINAQRINLQFDYPDNLPDARPGIRAIPIIATLIDLHQLRQGQISSKSGTISVAPIKQEKQ